MIFVYILVSALLLFSSALLAFKPLLIKTLMIQLINKNLIMVYGVVEIAMALGILYFKGEADYSLIPMIIGILLFVDGILYVLFSSRKEKLLTVLVHIQSNSLRKMSFITLMAGLGLLVSGLPVL